jgi:hypothetical protein
LTINSKKENIIYLFFIILLLNFYRKTIHSKHRYLILCILTILLVSTSGSALASSGSPYDSGYDHGCDDAGISDSSDRYINQPEKGPSFHTSEFMDGYYDGLDSCGDSRGGGYYEQPQQAQQNDQYYYEQPQQAQQNDQYYYEQPQQAQQNDDTLVDDLGQIVDCVVKAAPLASATGSIGVAVSGLGCGVYAAESDKQ